MQKTHDELLEHGKHYVNGKAPVFVFEHGTVVLLAKTEENAKLVMERWNVPGEGQGSAFGDFSIMKMSDGAVAVCFLEYKRAPIVLALRSVEEMGYEVPSGPLGPVLWTEREVITSLEARRLRSQDAREKNIVRSFIPEVTET